ncbi:unnamed protein product [Phytomonas sp. Hart1]|nr:unnamed protein product [Phytomonas sp. Hart1]|eukprot:CCW70615.1 unnamed protein product [Phytomonas sp. isolate Hart1]
MKDPTDYVSLPGLRTRTVTHREVQTEASFVPSCVDLRYAYEQQACEQFTQLRELRQIIESAMRQLAGNVYDIVGFKDVMFKHEEELPTSLPVTDMLLLTSKLYRTTCEIGRMLGCFFGVVFADDHSDEHFHFMEVRLLQKELTQLKKQLKESEEERMQLQQTLKNVGQLALNHGKAVEVLEGHNSALKLQTSALEDQMALLFQQLNTDLETNYKENFNSVMMEMKRQECLSSARMTFRQTMENLCEQLRGARGLVTDVRNTFTSCNQGTRTGEAFLAVGPTIRYKLKTLDSSLQQFFLRFNAMKDTVAETTQELFGALHERKRILHLSLQHIRLYDLQSTKFRTAKAILSKLSGTSAALLRRLQVTFPGGAITSVDRIGLIVTRQWHGGYTLASLQRQKGEAAAPPPPPSSSRHNSNSISTISGASVGSLAPLPHAPSFSEDSAKATMPGFTEAERMAAESELAALGDTTVLSQIGPGLDGGGAGYPLRPPTREMASMGDRIGGGLSASISNARGMETAQSFYTQLPQRHGVSPPHSGEDAEPFTNMQAMFGLFHEIGSDIEAIQEALTLQDEMSAFLKTLTLSIPTTERKDPIVSTNELASKFMASSDNPSGYNFIEHYEGVFENALIPTAANYGGTSPQQQSSLSEVGESDAWNKDGSRDGLEAVTARSGLGSVEKVPLTSKELKHSAVEKAQANSMLARQAQQLQYQQEVLSKMQEDFSLKLDFLRQVYEGRITDLEVKESSIEKTWTNFGKPLGDSINTRIGSISSIQSSSAPRQRNSIMMDSEKTILTGNGQSSNRRTPLPLSSTGDYKKLNKEKVVATRRAWQENTKKVASTEKLRKATMDALDRVEQRTKESSLRKQAKGDF